jgi:pyrroloquinoline-quinone synthase
MLDKATFKREMHNILDKHRTLGHPIFKHLMNDDYPNQELLKTTTLQGYQLTKNFLEYIETLFFYCPLPRHKKRLLNNMYEEETGFLSKTKNHVVLMQDFIKAIGISDEERDLAIALAPTQELIDYRMHACKTKELYHIGAAAVLVASEGQNLETIGEDARHNILGKVYKLTDEDLLFFSVHQKEDVGHVEQGKSLLADLCDTKEMQKEVLEAIEHTCHLFYNMYQGVYEHLDLEKVEQIEVV